MQTQHLCNSCSVALLGGGQVHFSCPSCKKSEIWRCKHCREIAAKYICPGCGFTGPN